MNKLWEDRNGDTNIVSTLLIIGIAVLLAVLFGGEIKNLFGNLIDSLLNFFSNNSREEALSNYSVFMSLLHLGCNTFMGLYM